VLRRLAKACLVAALAVSLGLHWALLQAVAWAGMVTSYSRTMPVAEALARTFDGKHPCNLCKLVREGQKSERHKEAPKPVAPLDASLAASATALFPPIPHPWRESVPHIAASRTESPPVPPPRSLQG